jgi:prepilin-type N-terminal cleavage/methylation domain-containing protein
MMAIIHRIRQRAGRSDDGLTLVEMLSTLVIMGVLTSIVSAMFITSVRAMHDNNIRLDQINTGRTAMDTITRVVRTSVLPSSLASCAGACSSGNTAFLQATPTSMSFYADIDNTNNTVGPTQVAIWIDAAGNLFESTQRPDPGSAPTGYAWTIASLKHTILLAKGVQSTNLFTYYQFGSTVKYTTVTGTALANVDAVDIVLKVDLPNTKAGATTYVQRVSLPNVDTIIQATASASP